MTTHDMRTVPGVDQDLVVGVGLPLHLLRAVGSGRLPFATARKALRPYTVQSGKPVFVGGEERSGGSPVRHGWRDVSVVEAGVPRKQDDASVAKHAVEEQLRTTTGRNHHWNEIVNEGMNEMRLQPLDYRITLRISGTFRRLHQSLQNPPGGANARQRRAKLPQMTFKQEKRESLWFQGVLPVPFHTFRAASQLQTLPPSPEPSPQVCSCQKHVTTRGVERQPKDDNGQQNMLVFQGEKRNGDWTRCLPLLKRSSRIFHPAEMINVHPRSPNPA